MTPIESALARCLFNAEAYISEGRVHHAHLIIQQVIAEYNISLAPVAAAEQSSPSPSAA